MAHTELSSAQIRDASIARVDLNTQTPGLAVVAKIVAGTGITISQTGADSGTGDVTVSALTAGDEVFIGTADPGAGYDLWYDTDEPAVDPTILLHHLTHEPGGADALANAVWTNRANVFTKAYGIGARPISAQAAIPMLSWMQTDASADNKLWRMFAVGGQLLLAATNDAETANSGVVTLNRTGDFTVGDSDAAKQSALYVRSGNPSLYLYDPSTTANARMWRIMNQSQLLRFYTQDDGETGHVTRMWLDRSGNMTVQRYLRVGGDYGAYPALRNAVVANPAGVGMLEVVQANEAQYAGVRAYNFISTGVYNSFADLTCTGGTNFQGGLNVSAGSVTVSAGNVTINGGVAAYQTLTLNDGGNPVLSISNSGGYLRINTSNYGQVTYMDMAGNWTMIGQVAPVGGVEFASTGALASATCLDYYKEMFWQPTFRCSGGGTPTYAIQHGLAVKVGRFVYFGGRCSISAKGSMATGGWVAMDGLPWVSEGTYWGGGMYAGYIVATAVAAGIGGYIPPGGQYIQMTANTTGGTNLLAPDWMNAGFDLIFFGSYYANS